MPIGTQDFEYVLDNEFFKNIEGEDVQKGKVKVKLTVKRTAASFELDFDLEGVIQIPCDRCLDDGELNIAWFLYEFIALTIPLKHVHQAGKCNKSMSAKLRKHAARSMDESEDAASYDDEDVVDEVPGEGEETDPRWDELKKIIDNN